MNTFWVTLPARTPMQLMIVNRARAIEPSIAARNSLVAMPNSSNKWFAKISDTAAIPPV